MEYRALDMENHPCGKHKIEIVKQMVREWVERIQTKIQVLKMKNVRVMCKMYMYRHMELRA